MQISRLVRVSALCFVLSTSGARAFDQCLTLIDEAAAVHATALADQSVAKAEGMAIYMTMRGFAQRGCANYPELSRLPGADVELDELLLSETTVASHQASCDQAVAGFRTMAEQARKYFQNTQYVFAKAMASSLADTLRAFESRCADLASPDYGKIHYFVDEVQARAAAAPPCNEDLEVIVEAAKRIARAREQGNDEQVRELESDENLRAAVASDACAMFPEKKQQALDLLSRGPTGLFGAK